MAQQANVNIYQGDDYTAEVTVLNADGTVADLTGYSVQSEIRPNYADASEPPLAAFQCAINANVITLLLTHDQTKLLVNQVYVWDIQLIDPTGWITTILAGKVIVTLEVTKIYATPTKLAVLKPPRRSHEGLATAV